ncbi:hypothetical protein KL930_002065 [Ogataea haglerorum]|uniref:Uncharacterized protein n=1 Tax=Ogataea haglerorum TaxID=1937702 RepID=A0AAN6D7F5_9ASCO|nr:hypothetical protein KL915_001440 [Ogataea haglerorum]KAG7700750.1 hypothetical protein KL951_000865 [Ogataea haglerorum]KAG7710190.1 hypothetical protein KL914_001100 [Ogataea haglerorum]KAG7728481.1 hypothetical protein KL933_001714 [Ogataea haglerorum]KAG7733794.1 hypothetical protein KL948_000996 [Ogataea haglerorum]
MLKNLPTSTSMLNLCRPLVARQFPLQPFIRLVTTAQLANRIPGDRYYEIKDNVDDYLYYKSLTPRVRDIVYTKDDHLAMLNRNAIDLEGRPLTPKPVPGAPSRLRFSFFIDGLLLPAELDDLFPVITKLDLHAPELLNEMVIKSFLYKAAEFNKLSDALSLVFQLETYKSNLRFNQTVSEAVILLRALEVEKSKITSLQWFNVKTRFVRRPDRKHRKKVNEPSSLLTELCGFINLQRAQVETFGEPDALVTKAVEKTFDRLQGFAGFNIADFKKSNLIKMYYGLEHIYTITKYLSHCVARAPELPYSSKYSDLVKQNEAFISEAEALQQKIGKKETQLEKLEALKFERKRKLAEETEEADKTE